MPGAAAFLLLSNPPGPPPPPPSGRSPLGRGRHLLLDPGATVAALAADFWQAMQYHLADTLGPAIPGGVWPDRADADAPEPLLVYDQGGGLLAAYQSEGQKLES